MGEPAARAAGADRLGVKQRGIEAREGFRNRLNVHGFRRRQRRIAVRELLADECRQRVKRLLFIFAADDQLAAVPLQGIGADNRQRAFRVSASFRAGI